jgi:hypothetical protein
MEVEGVGKGEKRVEGLDVRGINVPVPSEPIVL